MRDEIKNILIDLVKEPANSSKRIMILQTIILEYVFRVLDEVETIKNDLGIKPQQKGGQKDEGKSV